MNVSERKVWGRGANIEGGEMDKSGERSECGGGMNMKEDGCLVV